MTPLLRRCLLVTALAALPALARADGFADLRAALARAPTPATLKGTVKAESLGRQGDDKESEEDRGQASLDFDDGASGLRLLYPRELLARVDQETRARDKDPKAKTPATSGLRALEAADVRALLQPVSALLALLDDCVPKAEVAEVWNGKPARRLSCEIGIERLKGKDRKYIKRYEGKVELWIGATGLPLASRVDTSASGRAFVVIGFETASHLEQTFQVVGDRLVAVREERRSSGSGAGEKGESRVVRELSLAP